MTFSFSVSKEAWFACAISAVFVLLGTSGCVRQQQAGPASLEARQGARLVNLGNGICQDVQSGRMWQMGSSRTIHSLDAARAYTANLRLGGYGDWRLPTVTELYDLYMTFDLHLNGDCTLAVEGNYWSDEPDLEGRVGTWELDDNCDPERQYIPKKKGRVRAVRP